MHLINIVSTYIEKIMYLDLSKQSTIWIGGNMLKTNLPPSQGTTT